MTPEAAVHALSGRRPYAWQTDLLEQELLAGRVPAAMDIPTGLGKTTVMVLWLVARALAPDAGLPRRLIYVVDRRAVVDQATEVGSALRDRLGDGLDVIDPLVVELRQKIGLQPGRRLAISSLRGQLADNREWLQDPVKPSIVVGTVDMIGSRLLFEGYGISRRMRPVHAGLLGADALILLDEAHLVPPFEALIEQVIAQREAPGRLEAGLAAVVPPLRLMSLSATGRPATGRNVFRLNAKHCAEAAVHQRLHASKRLRVLDDVGAKDLARTLAERARVLGRSGGAVLVFVNSRATAQDVQGELAKPPHGLDKTALLVGERRVLERERLKSHPVYRRFMPETPRSDGAVFLIATSAGEVGVDLDADHMVCDLVTWERMVQRLGRVNRRAKPGVAEIEVVPVLFDSEKDREAETPVADVERLAVLRSALERLPTLECGRRDASLAAILAIRNDPANDAILQAATSEEPLRPLLTPALIEAWSLTSLERHPGRPLVAPWIRGWVVDDVPQTRVAWRRWLPPLAGLGANSANATLNGFFDAAPPHLTEILEAPTFRVADILKKRASAWCRPTEDAPAGTATAPEPFVVVLSASGEVDRRLGCKEIAQMKRDDLIPRFSGRTVVVDARLGGLDGNGLLDPKAEAPPPTWDAAAPAEEGAPGWTTTMLQAIGRRLTSARVDEPPAAGWVREAGWPLATDREQLDDDAVEMRVERLRAAPAAGDAARGTPEHLDQHQRRVGREARRIAAAVMPNESLRQVLVIAAEGHDDGKNRRQWQDAMGADAAERPWAKTDGRRADLSLLGGYRHEFGSLGDAEAKLRTAIRDPALQDLALHLIAAHHGHARPVIAAYDPAVPPFVSELRAREVALRFARLQRRWGPWGLAWWEALLRAADWAASREPAEAEPG